MRGKNIVWITMAAILVASIAQSFVGVSKAHPDYIVSVEPPSVGGTPGQSFSVDIEVDYAEGVRAFWFTLSWNPTILRLDSETPVVEGPFLPSGGSTFFVYAIGIGGGSIDVFDMITGYAWADAFEPAVMATLNFDVIGGGETALDLSAILFDVGFGEIPLTDVVDGYFFSPVPSVAFTWWVPTAKELDPKPTATTNGTSYYTTMDEDGDVDYHDGPSYLATRPVLTLDDATGAPEQVDLVEGATMFYGDQIIFDASATYDLNSTGQPDPRPMTYHWVIRAGGVDKFKWGGKWYDCRYESGVELPSTAVFSYVFPGSGPPGPGCDYGVGSVYGIYARLLGFHDLTLTVTDADGNVATYYTWIRIYRLSVAKTVNLVVPDPKHELSKDGYTKTFKGNMQNRGGTSWFIWESLSAYLSLARMIHAFMWIRIRFDIVNAAGKTVGRVYSDAVWLGPTETPDPSDQFTATWTMPPDIACGTYFVKARAYFCGSGVTYGLAATGTLMDSFEILP